MPRTEHWLCARPGAGHFGLGLMGSQSCSGGVARHHRRPFAKRPTTHTGDYVRKCPVNGISIGKGYEPSPRTLKVRLAQTSESLCRSSNLPKGTGPLGGCPGASRDTLLRPCFVIPGSVGVRLGARRKRGLRYPLSLPCTLCKRTQTEFPCTRKWTPVLHLLCTFLVRTFRLFNPLILHL